MNNCISFNRREFLGGLISAAALSGCRTSTSWWGETPELKFGVISDIHLTTPESTADLRRALAYFRERDVDAVVIAGDITDWGLKSGLELMAQAWFDIFPDNRAPDGHKVEKLFITGNHDYDGWWYGDMTLDMHTQGYSEDEALTRLGLKECWESIFHEPFDEIRSRKVKGFTFVSSEWHVNGKENGDADVAAYLDQHAAELRGEKPCFYFRHMPVPATVQYSGKPTVLSEALARIPNIIAFTGHTHMTLNDERSIWQGTFTALSIPSMSYTSMPSGYENGSSSRRANSNAGHACLPSRINLDEAQGYLVSVYANRVEVERRDFEKMCEAAEPWIFPLGTNVAKPYVYATHSAVVPIPQFPTDAQVATRIMNSATRSDRWTIYWELSFPAARAVDGGRVYDYEVRVELEDGGIGAVKRYLSPAFYKLPSDEPKQLVFNFDTMDVPESGKYHFAVYPRNSFGIAGKAIHSVTLEGKPGKDKAKYKH